MIQRIEAALKNRLVRYGIVAFGGGAAVGATVYNAANQSIEPIRVPARSSVLRSLTDDIVTVNMPEQAADSFDCGGEEGPIPLLNDPNPKNIVSQIGNRAVVDCHLITYVPVIGPDGQPKG